MKQKRSGVRILAAFLTALLLFYSLGTSVLAMDVSESGEIITEKMRAEEDPEECTEEKEALAAPVEEQSEKYRCSRRKCPKNRYSQRKCPKHW